MKVITMESSAFRSLTEQRAEIAAHVRAASGDKKAASPDRLLTTREAAHLAGIPQQPRVALHTFGREGALPGNGAARGTGSELPQAAGVRRPT